MSSDAPPPGTTRSLAQLPRQTSPTTSDHEENRQSETEERISKDPYDIVAWTSLLENGIATNMPNVIQGTFERFLTQFPSSVGP
jgi:hypothetical protein